MTHPFDPAGPADPSHLVLVDATGHRSLWPRWMPVPAGWSTEFGPAPHEDCLRALDAPQAGGGAPPRPALVRPTP
ncbi:MbtH family NRPS accessory protein [Streptomyces sp. NPDC058291]|uniref:MbtH family NRPS accessory protein n=1 Tax=Streptomyces sp. NPDC058291 TaxID=3346427 RepID=UPI0036EBCDE7